MSDDGATLPASPCPASPRLAGASHLSGATPFCGMPPFILPLRGARCFGPLDTQGEVSRRSPKGPSDLKDRASVPEKADCLVWDSEVFKRCLGGTRLGEREH
jgi:hypothetical protein